MGVILEIREGPMAGKVIGLRTGESVTIGRAAGRAQFALPHDTFMSGVHFAVECGPSGCRAGRARFVLYVHFRGCQPGVAWMTRCKARGCSS